MPPQTLTTREDIFITKWCGGAMAESRFTLVAFFMYTCLRTIFLHLNICHRSCPPPFVSPFPHRHRTFPFFFPLIFVVSTFRFRHPLSWRLFSCLFTSDTTLLSSRLDLWKITRLRLSTNYSMCFGVGVETLTSEKQIYDDGARAHPRPSCFYPGIR